jgi:hypothetical protein
MASTKPDSNTIQLSEQRAGIKAVYLALSRDVAARPSSGAVQGTGRELRGKTATGVGKQVDGRLNRTSKKSDQRESELGQVEWSTVVKVGGRPDCTIFTPISKWRTTLVRSEFSAAKPHRVNSDTLPEIRLGIVIIRYFQRFHGRPLFFVTASSPLPGRLCHLLMESMPWHF